MDTKDPTDRAVAFVLDNWDALGVTEHAGQLHMPATIKRRTAAGGIDETPVVLRNVSNVQRVRARTQSRSLALEWKLDLDRDADLVEQIENYSILCFAMRDPKTYDQHLPNVAALLDAYDTQALAELWGRYNTWIEMLDPRFGAFDAEELWRVIVRIAREKNPSPLVGMPGVAQFTCIVLMAEQALLSPMRPSWLQPSATSSAASSPAPSSD